MTGRIGNWKEVEIALSADIVAGRYKPGAKLPTETELCARFGVARHSLRRALAELASSGRIRIVQGSGAYVVEAGLLAYQIGHRTRFRSNLMAQGAVASGEITRSATMPASAEIAAELEIAEGAPVHMVEALGRADGVPLSISTSWHPAERFPRFLELRCADRSVTEVYAAHSVDDYFRRETAIYARPGLKREAELLSQPDGHPVVVVTKTDVDVDGRPIGMAEVVCASARVKFVISGHGAEIPSRDLQPKGSAQ